MNAATPGSPPATSVDFLYGEDWVPEFETAPRALGESDPVPTGDPALSPSVPAEGRDDTSPEPSRS